MRKRLIDLTSQDAHPPDEDEGWLDLDGLAVVEVTSEEKEYPAVGERPTKVSLECHFFGASTF